jgi:N-acetylneuraminic acid mutarotase
MTEHTSLAFSAFLCGRPDSDRFAAGERKKRKDSGRPCAARVLLSPVVAAGIFAAAMGVIAEAGAALRSETLPDYPDVLGVAAPVAGISDGVLLVGGGANFPNGFPWEGGKKVWHDTVYALAPSGSNWVAAGKLAHPLAYAVALTTDRGILVVGGSDAGRHHGEAFFLRRTEGRLVTDPLPALPVPAANACGALIGRTAIVAGGESAPGASEALTNVWALSVERPDEGWSSLPSWPGPARTLAAAGAQGGIFFLVGGVTLSAGPDGKPVRTYLKDAYAWDSRTNGWRRLADAPVSMCAAPSPLPTVGESHLLVMGGDDGSKYGFQPVQDHPGWPGRVFAYDRMANTWAQVGELPASRVTAPVVAWGGAFVIPSGEVRPGVRTPTVSRYTITMKEGR